MKTVHAEYAGFQYLLRQDETGRWTIQAVPGQHPAASKEKHRRAALEEYLREIAQRPKS